jgi:DNA-binding NarL/FixJ family response regulator
MVKIHITDKNIKLVEKLRFSINKSKNVSVDRISCKLKECRKQLTQQIPDVLLLGLAFPDGNGEDFCAEIRQAYPSVKILILTDDDEYSITKRVMGEGASGFIHRNALPGEFIKAIAVVMEGKSYIGGKTPIEEEDEQKVTPEWLKPLEQEIPKLIGKDCIEKLTQMVEFINMYRNQLITTQLTDETQILNTQTTDEYLEILTENLFLKGYSNWEIAGKLNIDIDTVRIYRMRLIQRLGTKNSMLFVTRKKGDTVKLTPVEMQLLRLITAGFINKETADKLYKSKLTIDKDRANLISKLGAKNTMEMVIDALRQGLIKLEDIDSLLSND